MKRNSISLLAVIGIAAFLSSPASLFAQTLLGTTLQGFTVLGGSTVTNTGPTIVEGNVGVSAGTSITGFPPGSILPPATTHSNDVLAMEAQTELTTAYTTVMNATCNTDLTGQDLGGLTLTPGVYCFDSSAQLTGTLTLDFQGNPDAQFIFKIGSALTTASSSSVIAINSPGSLCAQNLYWQIGTSATLGTGTAFLGNILANASITLTTGAAMQGKALARSGAVTLDTNTMTICPNAITCPTITVNPPTLPEATLGVSYNATVTASGSPGPFTFAVTSGALPSGLQLNSTTGAITGTPGSRGIFNFTITATDSTTGCPGARAYLLGVSEAPGVPALDGLGFAILMILVAAAGLFALNRFSI